MGQGESSLADGDEVPVYELNNEIGDDSCEADAGFGGQTTSNQAVDAAADATANLAALNLPSSMPGTVTDKTFAVAAIERRYASPPHGGGCSSAVVDATAELCTALS